MIQLWYFRENTFPQPYIARVVWKVKNILPYKEFIDNRKETKYAGFITHLYLLLLIVTLDTEALVVL